MIKPKHFAAAFALLLASVMLFSVLYIVFEADHDCCGEGCAVCILLQACENLLQNLLPAAAFLLAVWCFCALVRRFAEPDFCFERLHTLIVLKVKLSD